MGGLDRCAVFRACRFSDGDQLARDDRRHSCWTVRCTCRRIERPNCGCSRRLHGGAFLVLDWQAPGSSFRHPAAATRRFSLPRPSVADGMLRPCPRHRNALLVYALDVPDRDEARTPLLEHCGDVGSLSSGRAKGPNPLVFSGFIGRPWSAAGKCRAAWRVTSAGL